MLSALRVQHLLLGSMLDPKSVCVNSETFTGGDREIHSMHKCTQCYNAIIRLDVALCGIKCL